MLPFGKSLSCKFLIPSGTSPIGAENLSLCSCNHLLTLGFQARDSIFGEEGQVKDWEGLPLVTAAKRFEPPNPLLSYPFC